MSEDLPDETREKIDRFHEWLKLALEYADRPDHEDLAELIDENLPYLRGYLYLFVLQHKALLAERVQVEAQALEQYKQQERYYLGELLKKGQQYERESRRFATSSRARTRCRRPKIGLADHGGAAGVGLNPAPPARGFPPNRRALAAAEVCRQRGGVLAVPFDKLRTVGP